jgi:hypothetical protein
VRTSSPLSNLALSMDITSLTETRSKDRKIRLRSRAISR